MIAMDWSSESPITRPSLSVGLRRTSAVEVSITRTPRGNAAQPIAHEVEDERHHEQQHADRKDRPVLQRPCRGITEADLHDIRGHRFDGHHGIERQTRLLPRGNRNNHRLADGAGDGQDEGCGNTGERCRHDDPEGRLHAGCAERKRPFTQSIGHRMERILGQGRKPAEES